jgi:hypothetical protein
MLRNKNGRKLSRLLRWFHRTFDDWSFRYLLGPAQVGKAVDGTEPAAREGWKHDLERRKRYSHEQREGRHRAHVPQTATDHAPRPSSTSGTR